MSLAPKQRMTVDEFLAWSEATPGRFELRNGVVIEMQAERVGHATTKFAIQTALAAAIQRANIPCRVFPDGVTVRIDNGTAFEPDALVYCGPPLLKEMLEVPNPIVVVEVLSPSTKATDFSAKLDGYFRVASVMHYLIVDPQQLPIIHHRRQPDGSIQTKLVGQGLLRLDPPGIELNVDGLLD